MKVFDKEKYANAPSPEILAVIEKLTALGPAVVALRGPSFSANLLGPVSMGDDNGDPVLRVGNCNCHVHVMWNDIKGWILGKQDVGFGPEPVVYFFTEATSPPLINVFYPKKTYEEVKAALK